MTSNIWMHRYVFATGFCLFFQVLFLVRSVGDSLMTRATGRGTLSAHTEAKGNGPASFVANQCGKGEAPRVLIYTAAPALTHWGLMSLLIGRHSKSTWGSTAARSLTCAASVDRVSATAAPTGECADVAGEAFLCWQPKLTTVNFSLRLHLRVHHDDKRYECDECGKTFIRHDHLTKHQKIHSGRAPVLVNLVYNVANLVYGQLIIVCLFQVRKRISARNVASASGATIIWPPTTKLFIWAKKFGRSIIFAFLIFVQWYYFVLFSTLWLYFAFFHSNFCRYKTALHQCEVCKKEFKGKSNLEMHFRTHSGKKNKNKTVITKLAQSLFHRCND